MESLPGAIFHSLSLSLFFFLSPASLPFFLDPCFVFFLPTRPIAEYFSLLHHCVHNLETRERERQKKEGGGDDRGRFCINSAVETRSSGLNPDQTGQEKQPSYAGYSFTWIGSKMWMFSHVYIVVEVRMSETHRLQLCRRSRGPERRGEGRRGE